MGLQNKQARQKQKTIPIYFVLDVKGCVFNQTLQSVDANTSVTYCVTVL